VRQVAAEDLGVNHSRQDDVIGKLRLAGALRARVDFAKRLANYVEWFPVFLIVSHSIQLDSPL
jgi:hypothetical protein